MAAPVKKAATLEKIARTEGMELSWTGATYTRVALGVYSVVGRKSQGPEWVRRYQRWSLRIEFELLDDSQLASRFFNLGNDPKRYHIGQIRSISNGGRQRTVNILSGGKP